jgi:hypothetical protein
MDMSESIEGDRLSTPSHELTDSRNVQKPKMSLLEIV